MQVASDSYFGYSSWSEFYDDMENPVHYLLSKKVCEWRNTTAYEPSSTGEIIGRRVVCGFALAGFSLLGIIDIIASLALSILTCPLEIVGLLINSKKFQFSRHFGFRALLGIMSSGIGLSYVQYANVTQETVNI